MDEEFIDYLEQEHPMLGNGLITSVLVFVGVVITCTFMPWSTTREVAVIILALTAVYEMERRIDELEAEWASSRDAGGCGIAKQCVRNGGAPSAVKAG